VRAAAPASQPPLPHAPPAPRARARAAPAPRARAAPPPPPPPPPAPQGCAKDAEAAAALKAEGNALFARGRLRDAAERYSQALRLQPAGPPRKDSGSGGEKEASGGGGGSGGCSWAEAVSALHCNRAQALLRLAQLPRQRDEGSAGEPAAGAQQPDAPAGAQAVAQAAAAAEADATEALVLLSEAGRDAAHPLAIKVGEGVGPPIHASHS
jgi:tetratricopeptide (TPR) repeat protein